MSEEDAVYDRIMDYSRTFSDGHGRNVLTDLCAQYEQRSSFVPGDPYATAFREGQRDVVLAIKAVLRTAEDKEFMRETVGEFLTTDEGDNDGY
jgi:hypothetical protein